MPRLKLWYVYVTTKQTYPVGYLVLSQDDVGAKEAVLARIHDVAPHIRSEDSSFVEVSEITGPFLEGTVLCHIEKRNILVVQ